MGRLATQAGAIRNTEAILYLDLLRRGRLLSWPGDVTVEASDATYNRSVLGRKERGSYCMS